MYGHLNIIIKEYIIDSYGDEAWDRVVQAASCESSFEDKTKYGDYNTKAMIDAACKVSGLNREPFLVMLGEQYFRYLQRNGHDEFLRNLGGNMLDFLQNLDSVHTYMMGTYPEMNAPSFRCDADSSTDRMVLHYYSFRNGYHPLVTGIIKQVARVYFKVDLRVDVVSITQENVCDKNGDREHVIYNILATKMAENVKEAPPTFIAQTKKHGERQISKSDVEAVAARLEQIRREHGEDALPLAKARKAGAAKAKFRALAKLSMLHGGFVPNYPQEMVLTPKIFCDIFPWHVIFTSEIRCFQVGIQIQRLMPNIRTAGSDLLTYFDIMHPHSVDLTYENILNFINTPFVLKFKEAKMSQRPPGAPILLLRGQMIHLKDRKMILYLASPYVRTLKDLEDRKMYFAEIPVHDVTRDLILLDMEYRIRGGMGGHGGLGNTGDGGGGGFYGFGAGLGGGGDGGGDSESLMSELNRTKMALEKERFKGDQLMHYYLPRQMVDDYRSGRVVDPTEYKEISALFCDIVNFIGYAARCRPFDVINMLNQLQNKFDKVTKVHDTFRVESIGDAYLVISGVPDRITTHPERIANTALGMLYVAESVRSPLSSSQSVKVRIGVHSGSIKAGIIGDKIPRFIVMGETAVIASRMESHGIAGKVHISPATNKLLKGKGFTIKDRGEIQLRGRGNIDTYLIIQNDHATEEDLTSGNGMSTDPGLANQKVFMYSDTPGNTSSKMH